MELDNIIYIIIAIVLAIVNAVAQKKKKAAKENAPKNIFEINDEPEEQLEPDTSKLSGNFFDEIIDQNPIEALFGKESFEQEDVLDDVTDEGISALEEQSIANEQKRRMNEKAQELMSFKHEQNTFDFDEDSIASSAIGNALSEEEELEAQFESQSLILREFDAKKAILYSEIIKPKYFSLGVNN